MTEGNFVDYINLEVKSGNGGEGSSHFRREKFVAKGGPDGGDGGNGGNIFICADENLWTLYHFKYKKHFIAGDGDRGGKSRSTGSNGRDIIINVPIGTIVKETKTGRILLEVLKDQEKKLLLKGGKGGQGNWNFKSPTNQAPRYSQKGQKGNKVKVTLELKILADVGIVGFPNSGKSTLLASITKSKPKIADYPFTTLKPNLGIVPYREFSSFVIADIPGIIEGASKGKGLGHHFLRHIERNSVLLFLIPVDNTNCKKTFQTLQKEMNQYNPELLDKRYLIAFSKSDLLEKELFDEFLIEAKKNFKKTPFCIISSVNNSGLEELKDMIWEILN
ncbi:MAG: GTPase ObgE [Flavobacteriaceae bacterium]|nr:GTPase ObgE [Flavobacteriaceae bacterium]|tara:strand:- start:33601 stop:34599 length:999 start_codon:yes stop_codon:yes gene_type:complete